MAVGCAGSVISGQLLLRSLGGLAWTVLLRMTS